MRLIVLLKSTNQLEKGAIERKTKLTVHCAKLLNNNNVKKRKTERLGRCMSPSGADTFTQIHKYTSKDENASMHACIYTKNSYGAKTAKKRSRRKNKEGKK